MLDNIFGMVILVSKYNLPTLYWWCNDLHHYLMMTHSQRCFSHSLLMSFALLLPLLLTYKFNKTTSMNYKAHWCDVNTLDLYLGYAKFKSWARAPAILTAASIFSAEWITDCYLFMPRRTEEHAKYVRQWLVSQQRSDLDTSQMKVRCISAELPCLTSTSSLQYIPDYSN